MPQHETARRSGGPFHSWRLRSFGAVLGASGFAFGAALSQELSFLAHLAAELIEAFLTAPLPTRGDRFDEPGPVGGGLLDVFGQVADRGSLPHATPA